MNTVYEVSDFTVSATPRKGPADPLITRDIWPPPRPLSVAIVAWVALAWLALDLITDVWAIESVAAVGGWVGLSLALVFQIGMGLLFWIGLLRGHPLARGWSLFISGCWVASGVLGVVAGLVTLNPAGLVHALGLGIPIGLIVVMTRPAVRHFFGMTCPVCRGVKLRASFLYGRLTCKSCSHVWMRKERTGVDVAAFD